MGTQAIAIIPGLAWVVFAFVALWLLRGPVSERLRQVRSLSALGVSVQFDPGVVADELGAADRARGREADGDGGRLLVERAERVGERLARMRVLWVDDEPARIVHERRALTALGASVDTVTDSADCLALLQADGGYALVISDNRRGERERAGLDMVGELQARGHRLPVILYIGAVDHRPPPGGVAAIVDAPTDLLREVVRVAERAAG